MFKFKGFDVQYRETFGEYENTKRDIIYFLLLRELRYGLITETTIAEPLRNINNLLKKDIPSNKWEEGKTYKIGKKYIFVL